MNSQQDSELQLLYQQSKQQLSDLAFLEDEMKFLLSLLDNYFLSMIQSKNLNRAHLICNQLAQLKMLKVNVTKDLLVHQGNLHAKINSLLAKSIDFLKIENDKIQTEIKDLNMFFKNIKKEIFTIYKDLPSEKQIKSIS